MKLQIMHAARHALLLVGLSTTLFQLPVRANVLVDGYRWYTSGSSTSLYTVEDATVNPNGPVLTSTSAALIVTNLEATSAVVALTDQTTVTLSLTFRDVAKTGIRIGLFNSNGTISSADGTNQGTAATDDAGAVIDLGPSGFMVKVSDTNSFYGGTWSSEIKYNTISGLGQYLNDTAHTFSLSISRSADTYTIGYILDGVILTSIASTNASLATIDKIIFTQKTGTPNMEFGQITLSVVPEPRRVALLGLAAAMILSILGKGRNSLCAK